MVGGMDHPDNKNADGTYTTYKGQQEYENNPELFDSLVKEIIP